MEENKAGRVKGRAGEAEEYQNVNAMVREGHTEISDI